MIKSEDVKNTLDKIAKARAMVSDICNQKRDWILSIPADPVRDPDLVISAALDAAEKILEKGAYPPPMTNPEQAAESLKMIDLLGDIHAGLFPGLNPRARENWTWVDSHWRFNAPRGSASVWPNGTWHTFDSDGQGGENASDETIEKAMDEAEAAISRQGWDKEDAEALADFSEVEKTILAHEDDGEIARLRMKDGRAAWERIKERLGILIKIE